MRLVDRFLEKSEFSDTEDFLKNFKVKVPDNFNFGYDVVDEYAKIEPDKKALIWTNDEGECINYTFADLKRETDKTASYFLSLGIGKGDCVMLILRRSYQFWYSIVALHKIGAICIPATHMLMAQDIVYRNNSAGVKAIVAIGEKGLIGEIDKAMIDSPTVKHRITIGPEIHEGWEDFNKGIENAPKFVRPEHVNENSDPSLLYFTSGTSGEPKMVIHDFVYPLGHIITASYWQNVKENGIHLTVADTGWGKAVWGKLYGQWLAGCTVFVYDHKKFTSDAILKMIGKYRITSFCGPPTVYRFMIQEDFTKYDLSSLEYCTTAGEALSANVFNIFKDKTGIEIKEGFGQTETVCSIGTFLWVKPKPGSMGIPSPLYDLDLVTPEGRSCEDGETGEIIIRTEKKKPLGLFIGYYNNPELTKTVWYDGIYHTGDQAWRDEDGYYWFVGRVDDVIKSSGYRIGPSEVEGALMEHPAVMECAITAVPDKIRGQIVKATIVLIPKFRPGTPELVKDIQNFVKHTTAPYKYPRCVEFVDELPKTISGKIKRAEIRKGNCEK